MNTLLDHMEYYGIQRYDQFKLSFTFMLLHFFSSAVDDWGWSTELPVLQNLDISPRNDLSMRQTTFD